MFPAVLGIVAYCWVTRRARAAHDENGRLDGEGRRACAGKMATSLADACRYGLRPLSNLRWLTNDTSKHTILGYNKSPKPFSASFCISSNIPCLR